MTSKVAVCGSALQCKSYWTQRKQYQKINRNNTNGSYDVCQRCHVITGVTLSNFLFVCCSTRAFVMPCSRAKNITGVVTISWIFFFQTSVENRTSQDGLLLNKIYSVKWKPAHTSLRCVLRPASRVESLERIDSPSSPMTTQANISVLRRNNDDREGEESEWLTD